MRGRRRRLLLLLLVPICAGGAIAALLVGRGGSSTDAPSTQRQSQLAARRKRGTPRLRRLVERPTGTLSAPVQDAAVVALTAQRALLLGGLTAADTSSADVVTVTPAGGRAAGVLPAAVQPSSANLQN
jgi:hypothetical protein